MPEGGGMVDPVSLSTELAELIISIYKTGTAIISPEQDDEDHLIRIKDPKVTRFVLKLVCKIFFFSFLFVCLDTPSALLIHTINAYFPPFFFI